MQLPVHGMTPLLMPLRCVPDVGLRHRRRCCDCAWVQVIRMELQEFSLQ